MGHPSNFWLGVFWNPLVQHSLWMIHYSLSKKCAFRQKLTIDHLTIVKMSIPKVKIVVFSFSAKIRATKRKFGWELIVNHLYLNILIFWCSICHLILNSTRCDPLGLLFQAFKTCCNYAIFRLFPFLSQGLFSEIVTLWNSTIIWVHKIVAHSLLCGNFVKVWTLSKFRGVSQVVSQVGELEELKSEKFPPLLAFPLLC